jgi:hypothetical protein
MIRNESGSMTPLAIGFALISTAAILVTFAASTLFIFQKRLTNFSESAVLYVTSEQGSIDDFVSEVWNPQFAGQSFTKQTLSDGITVQIISCANWLNPIPIYLVPGKLKVCGHASARSG